MNVIISISVSAKDPLKGLNSRWNCVDIIILTYYQWYGSDIPYLNTHASATAPNKRIIIQ